MCEEHELKILRYKVGLLETNCYLIYSTEIREAAIIDPGLSQKSEAKPIMEKIKELNLKVKYIINTHGHHDHVSGNWLIKKFTDAPILIHRLDEESLNLSSHLLLGLINMPPKVDCLLEGGEVLSVGRDKIRVVHTPGHTLGSIILVGEWYVFTGDTLFAGSIGRVDLPGSSERDMAITLKKKILRLPDNLKVYPGHGPFSLMGVEKRFNPFLSQIEG